mmetsp:Transcript_52149/g.52542  ORF Transcript_52149/g.52542 Transcript_52149/m.52542 type:complete len:99 (+) Transcript_52149:469-765(+)
MIGKAGPGRNTVVMAGYIAKEYLLMQERTNNVKELQENNIDIDFSGRYNLYLSILPWEQGMNGLNPRKKHCLLLGHVLIIGCQIINSFTPFLFAHTPK